jgi:nitrogen regulatory protein P-II 2
VTEVRGHGKQKGPYGDVSRQGIQTVSLLPKTKVEVVLHDHLVEGAVKAIMAAARTGEIGDGRIFVLPISQSYKIRTGETDAV